jgi:hypothetical protein
MTSADEPAGGANHPAAMPAMPPSYDRGASEEAPPPYDLAIKGASAAFAVAPAYDQTPGPQQQQQQQQQHQQHQQHQQQHHNPLAVAATAAASAHGNAQSSGSGMGGGSFGSVDPRGPPPNFVQPDFDASRRFFEAKARGRMESNNGPPKQIANVSNHRALSTTHNNPNIESNIFQIFTIFQTKSENALLVSTSMFLHVCLCDCISAHFAAPLRLRPFPHRAATSTRASSRAMATIAAAAGASAAPFAR